MRRSASSPPNFGRAGSRRNSKGNRHSALITASSTCAPRHGASPASQPGAEKSASSPNNQPVSAKPSATPSALPRLTINIARPRCSGAQKSAQSESAAVSDPVDPMPTSIRAAVSNPALGAKAVSKVPSVQSSASPIVSRTRLRRSTRMPTGIEKRTIGTAAPNPWIRAR